MKRNIQFIGAVLWAATSLFLSACDKDSESNTFERYRTVLEVTDDGASSVNLEGLMSLYGEAAVLTQDENLNLLRLKEEEKLARDVYSELYQKWNSVTFQRIALSEENHLQAVIQLLAYYGSTDTLAGEPGVFADSELQVLYNQLLEQAQVSTLEAFRTGAFIEELDLNDIESILSHTADANVQIVLENLQRASRNHLRAFTSQVTSLGMDYLPVLLSQEEFDAIVSTSMEKGKQYRMQDGTCNGSAGQSRNNRKRHGW